MHKAEHAPWAVVIVCAAVLYLVGACGGQADPEPAAAVISPQEAGSTLASEGKPELLSEWGQLDIGDGHLAPSVGVVAYELNSALFSDYSQKLRTVWLPDGSDPAGYQADQVFDFPVGTVITKTFYFPIADDDRDQVVKLAASTVAPTDSLNLDEVRLIETRVLVHRADGWDAFPYVWNDEQTEATLQRTGDLVSLTLVDGPEETAFTYVVPDENQCANCHATNHTTGVILPIGPKARHLNRMIDLGDGPTSQIELWQRLGMLDGVPATSEIPETAVWHDDQLSLDERARAYLDINCAHCHNSAGSADTSALFLEPATDVGASLGICKSPIAAGTGTGGRSVGISPGQPDDSIFVFRMQTTDPGAMMPELGRAVTHKEGVALISDWIASLDGAC